MRAHATCGVVVAVLGLVAGVARGAEPDTPKPAVTAERVRGEWFAQGSLEDREGQVNIIVNFRPSGICRIDTVDGATGEKVRVDDLPATKAGNHLSNVGQWRVDGTDIVVVWERWDEATNRPAQREVRYRVESLSDDELVFKVFHPDGKSGRHAHLWRRFQGWDQWKKKRP